MKTDSECREEPLKIIQLVMKLITPINTLVSYKFKLTGYTIRDDLTQTEFK